VVEFPPSRVSGVAGSPRIPWQVARRKLTEVACRGSSLLSVVSVRLDFVSSDTDPLFEDSLVLGRALSGMVPNAGPWSPQSDAAWVVLAVRWRGQSLDLQVLDRAPRGPGPHRVN
jgi:hypothetical protein